MDLVKKAHDFAKARHEGQYRRDGITPYFTHCEKVAALLESNLEKAVAYCHDLIEDGRASYEEISQELGIEVANHVKMMTHSRGEDYSGYIRHFLKKDHGLARSVKVADIVANLSDTPTPKQVKKYHSALKILAGHCYDET